MTWSRAFAVVGCVALVACSGGGGGKGTKKPVDGGPGDGATGNGAFLPGVDIDLNGDGMPDGVAVDSDGDGVADGVDVDGDGIIDQPLPAGPDGGTTGISFPTDPTGSVLCGTAACQCNDGIDNDGDGVTDLGDAECVSSWDNDEGSLATGISGDNRDGACQDCFFDGNSGSGDDGCRTPTSCILDGTAESGRGSCSKCEQTDQCKNFCQAFTPNGCDCFGCCDVNLGGTIKHVLLEAGCDINGTQLDNCTECVPSTTCVNTCGRCELCPGKSIDDLPADCVPPPPVGSDGGTGTGSDGGTGTGDGGTTTPPPPPYTCDDGGSVCGAGLPECPSDSLCQFGCCVRIPILI